ncbi:hypothetical protein [Arvimicrobium flavum]|uniref:hypothetical protein n=1 Tax=Arvimicrobium flavum TaxID=3393320 RepID=UPI00237A8058|nr:hypothetical protein [Mesorhizobium shangrilense]
MPHGRDVAYAIKPDVMQTLAAACERKTGEKTTQATAHLHRDGIPCPSRRRTYLRPPAPLKIPEHAIDLSR